MFPFRALAVYRAGDATSLPLRPPLMQLASPAEYFRIVGSALLVQRSPLALGCHSVLQGFPDNSLRFGWYAESLLS
jgi:hypothetical protein